MEFLGYNKHTEESYNKAKEFLDYANIIQLGDSLVEQVINIKREKKIKLPDAIIAASAISNRFTLVTRNIKDFIGISINIYNPFEAET